MATVIVRSDVDQTTLMHERVSAAHLDDEHSSVQFLERLAWAIGDEDAQRRVASGQLRRRVDAVRREGLARR